MELIDLYDENRKPIGKTIKRGEPIMHLYIFVMIKKYKKIKILSNIIIKKKQTVKHFII